MFSVEYIRKIFRFFVNRKFDFWEELSMIKQCVWQLFSCHVLYIDSIILEERREMNKKILDVTAAAAFCICLIVTAKIDEKTHVQTEIEKLALTEENDAVTAGVCRVLSEYSFTTESDEKTGIEKKQVVMVTSPESEEHEEEMAENDIVEENETSETVAAYQNRWNITLTQEEIDLLARIVWLESCGEPQKGQEAVVEVIFNRIASDKYPDTLYDVLSQGNPTQFCSWKNRDIARPTEKEYQSIENVLNGNTNILRNDTLYFSTEPLTSRLDVMIGGHSFCY